MNRDVSSLLSVQSVALFGLDSSELRQTGLAHGILVLLHASVMEHASALTRPQWLSGTLYPPPARASANCRRMPPWLTKVYLVPFFASAPVFPILHSQTYHCTCEHWRWRSAPPSPPTITHASRCGRFLLHRIVCQ
jgi:hypothetical protein